MEEVDHAQCRGQVLSSHQVWRHHGDQCHICAIEVTIEDSEGHEEWEGPKQRRKEAAETLHRHREDVTSQTVRLQTPERRTEKTCFYFKQEEIKTDFNHPEKKTGRRQFTDASAHTSCPSASQRWCSPWCRWLPGWTWGRRPAGGWARLSDRRAPGRWRGGCSRWPATGRTQPGPGSPAAAGNGTPCWTGSRSWSTASSAAEGRGFPTEEAGAKTKTCLMKRGCPLILWTVLLRAQRPVMTRYLRQIILKSDSLNFNLLYFCSANFRRSVILMSLLNFVAAAQFVQNRPHLQEFGLEL